MLDNFEFLNAAMLGAIKSLLVNYSITNVWYNFACRLKYPHEIDVLPPYSIVQGHKKIIIRNVLHLF